MFVDELTCGDTFMVTQFCVENVPVILRWGWQRNYSCFFDWNKNLAHFQGASNKLWVPLCQPLKDRASNPITTLDKELTTTTKDNKSTPLPST